MTNTYKVLGQLDPSAATATSLYTVPASTQAIPKPLAVTNRSATATSFRVAVRVAGASLTTTQYVAYDQALPGNETVYVELPPLGATDVVTVYATLATVSFVLGGVEIT